MHLILLVIAIALVACGNEGNGSNNQIGSGNTINTTINNTTIVQASDQSNIDVSAVQKTEVSQNVSSESLASVSSFTSSSSTGETGTFVQNGIEYHYYQTSETDIFYWYRNSDDGACVTTHRMGNSTTSYIYECDEAGEAIEDGELIFYVQDNGEVLQCVFIDGKLEDCIPQYNSEYNTQGGFEGGAQGGFEGGAQGGFEGGAQGGFEGGAQGGFDENFDENCIRDEFCDYTCDYDPDC